MSELLINDIKSNNSELKSYNEGMQIIEEMAQILKDYTKKNNIMASHVILECYAEELYSKNYRKQSEGEWVVEAYKGDDIVIIPYIEHQHDEPFCSLCGKYALLDGGGEYVTSKFCPNCGSKMKGGVE